MHYDLSRAGVKVRCVVVIAVALIFLIYLVSLASAQHDHAAGHEHYSKWTNRNGAQCCNNADCGSLKPEEEKRENGKLYVKVENTWCEVLPHMYLKTGNAPDWSSSHVCVWPSATEYPQPVCQRLTCYQPRPLF